MNLDIRTSKYVQLLLQVENKPKSHVVHVREVEDLIDAHFSHIDTISSELLQADQKSAPRQRMHLDELLERASRIKTSLLALKFEFQRALLTLVPPDDGVRNLRRHLELSLLWEAEAGQLAGVLWEHRQIIAFQADSAYIEGLARKGWERISAVRGDHVHCLRLLLWKQSVNTKLMVHVLTEVARGLEEMLAHWQEAKMNAEDHGVALEVFGWDGPAIELLGSAKVMAARAAEAARTWKWDADLVLELGLTAKELLTIVNVAPDEVLRCSVVLKHREVMHKALADYGALHQTRSLHGFLRWFHKESTAEWIERNYERLSLAFQPLYERYFLEHGVIASPSQMSLRVDIPLAGEVSDSAPPHTTPQVKCPTPEHDGHIPLLNTTGSGSEPAIAADSEERPTLTLVSFSAGPPAVSDAVSSSCPAPIDDPDAVSSSSPVPPSVKLDAVSSSCPIAPSILADATSPSSFLAQTLAESIAVSSTCQAVPSTPSLADRSRAGSSGDAASSSRVIGQDPVPSGPLDTLIPPDATVALANAVAPWCVGPISPHGVELRDSFIRKPSRTNEDLAVVANQGAVGAGVTNQGCERTVEAGLVVADTETGKKQEEAGSVVPLVMTLQEDLVVCAAAAPAVGHSSAFSASTGEDDMAPNAGFSSTFSSPEKTNSAFPPPKEAEDKVVVTEDHDTYGYGARQSAGAVLRASPSSSSSTDSAEASPSIPFGVHNFKQCASESPTLISEQQRLFDDCCVVFLMTRNKINNVVVYRALESKNPPVEAFWWNLSTVPRPANLRSAVNWVEKKFAYGITCKPQPPHHQVRIVAIPDRPAILTWDLERHGRPVCLIRVLDRVCILYRVHLHVSETAYWPKVEWINIHGIEVCTGVELVEIVKP